MEGLKTLIDREGNRYSFREDNPHIVASNQIYVAEENPDIYIKVLKHPSLLEHPKEHKYIRDKIEYELKMAKTLSGNFFPVPHVYYAKIETNPEYITGYIVMDRIKGRIIGSEKELDKYFDKIIGVLNDLLKFGILYKDMNINNFIIGEEDDDIYIIDFEDAVPYEPDNPDPNLILQNLDGSISLNEKYIKTALKGSVRVRRKYRMDDSAASTPVSSPGRMSRSSSREFSPGKTAKSRSPKKLSPGKTAKKHSPKTSPKK